MSSCTEEMKDYDLVKKYCRCKFICLKTNFYKNKIEKDEVNYFCKFSMNKCMNEYNKNEIKKDVNFR